MKNLSRLLKSAACLMVMSLAVCYWPSRSLAALDQTFDVLQVGTTTYRNVTVTTKTKSYVFILHTNGMASIKVADLTPETLAKLGYEDPKATKPASTNSPAAWAKTTLARLDTAEMKRLEAQAAAWAPPVSSAAARLGLRPPTRNQWLLAGALFVGLYLFGCYCCKLICEKCGTKPGLLVWVPLLHLIPLLKAASMSGWWFFGFLVPVLNVVPLVLWYIKIVQARGKSGLVVLLLILPLTSPLAFLYLAFSSGKPEPKPTSRRVPLMTLEAA